MQVLASTAADGAAARAAREALQDGGLVVLPTDTVYGIAARADDADACRRLYEAKGRELDKPTAVLFAHVEQLLEALEGLSVRARFAVHALLPGPFTLVVRVEPGHPFEHLCGADPTRLGVRVPAGAVELPAVAATSANDPGEPEIERVEQLPDHIRDAMAVAIDRGPLRSGRSSTVLDLTAWEGGGELAVLRDPARLAGQAMAVLLAAPHQNVE